MRITLEQALKETIIKHTFKDPEKEFLEFSDVSNEYETWKLKGGSHKLYATRISYDEDSKTLKKEAWEFSLNDVAELFEDNVMSIFKLSPNEIWQITKYALTNKEIGKYQIKNR